MNPRQNWLENKQTNSITKNTTEWNDAFILHTQTTGRDHLFSVRDVMRRSFYWYRQPCKVHCYLSTKNDAEKPTVLYIYIACMLCSSPDEYNQKQRTTRVHRRRRRRTRIRDETAHNFSHENCMLLNVHTVRSRAYIECNVHRWQSAA